MVTLKCIGSVKIYNNMLEPARVRRGILRLLTVWYKWERPGRKISPRGSYKRVKIRR